MDDSWKHTYLMKYVAAHTFLTVLWPKKYVKMHTYRRGDPSAISMCFYILFGNLVLFYFSVALRNLLGIPLYNKQIPNQHSSFFVTWQKNKLQLWLQLRLWVVHCWWLIWSTSTTHQSHQKQSTCLCIQFMARHMEFQLPFVLTCVELSKNETTQQWQEAAKQQQEKARSHRAEKKNYSTNEVNLFLDLMEEVLPIGGDEWQNVCKQFNSFFHGDWNVESLRRKFASLHRKRIPTGDPSMPYTVRKAKLIHHLIGHKTDLGYEEDAFDLEEGVF